MKRKPKKTSRIKLACTLVQLYARLRDTDRNGTGKCCSCGKILQWGEGNGGHWHPKTRGYNAACLLPTNVHLQCPKCNLFNQGEVAGYTQFMLSKYGEQGINVIADVSHTLLDKISIESSIDSLRYACKQLAKEKNFTVRVP